MAWYNLVENTEIYGRKGIGKRRATSAILRAASNFKGTVRQIAEEAGVTADVRNVRGILLESKQQGKMKTTDLP